MALLGSMVVAYVNSTVHAAAMALIGVVKLLRDPSQWFPDDPERAESKECDDGEDVAVNAPLSNRTVFAGSVGCTPPQL